MKRLYGFEYYAKNILKIDLLNQDEKTKFFNKLETNISESYVKFQIPKKDGMRDICAIDKSSILYTIQKNLNKNFLSKIPLSSVAIGFVKGKSYNDFLAHHIGKKYYMRMDIKDFFGFISEKHIKESLKEFVQESEIIESIVNICMREGELPQGAVTSPTISNIIFRRIDQRIIKYCQSIQNIRIAKKNYNEDIIYTRYADDMLFSSNILDFKENKYFKKMIKNILSNNEFKVNYNKMYYSSDSISLSGFVIEKDVHLSRKKMKNINSILYFFDKRIEYDKTKYNINIDKIEDTQLIKQLNDLNLNTLNGRKINFENIAQFINYLCGYRSFLISFLKMDIRKTDSINLIEKKVKKIEELINKINEINDFRTQN
ncbi:reverse transcriptase family protein [Clostridium estertheticum]|uniref:reverse transcriptase family protein n=1 Tax=Clostridium estertheticum TaxID=238834 RepID=UPI001C0C1C77|nr:reverse transcriptase family protein [Clostridium estertheticum]MBU3202212.1 reverse transcriptase family protein [Clostridium estertheticum]WAG67901.1 reverse transcriptase family protein [Clostridium estertheticum]